MRFTCLMAVLLSPAALAAPANQEIASAETREFYLSNLPVLKEYQSRRATNCPYYPPRLSPGQSMNLLDVRQPGVITHTWATGDLSLLWFKVFFDGETQPSLEGHWEDLCNPSNELPKNIRKQPVGLIILPHPGYNSYIPMPFRKSARIVAENRGDRELKDTYFMIDYIVQSADAAPDCRLTFDRQRKAYRYVGPDADWSGRVQENRHAAKINFKSESLSKSSGRLTLEPGSERSAVRLQGAGIVQRLELTTDKPTSLHIVLRYEGSTTPAVDCPLDRFFGQLNSLVFERRGSSRICHFPMPYRKAWELSIKNVSDSRVSLQADANYREAESVPDAYAYFHARFNRADGQPGENYRLTDVVGRGHFVGLALFHTASTQMPIDHAGADFVYGDAETDHPFAIRAIGGEDYFCAAYFGRSYTTPHVGASDNYEHGGQRYRFHWESPVPFTNSLAVDFAIYPGNSYESTAFWYQDRPEPTSAEGIAWKCIGPFNVASQKESMLRPPIEIPPTKDANHPLTVRVRNMLGDEFERPARRRTAQARNGFVDFWAENTQRGPNANGAPNSTIYTVSQATTCLTVDKSTPATILLGHCQPIEIRLRDGTTKVFGQRPVFGVERIPVQLSAGANPIRIRSAYGTHPFQFGWDGFSMIVLDAMGKSYPAKAFSADEQ